jgi:hypothetical protein
MSMGIEFGGLEREEEEYQVDLHVYSNSVWDVSLFFVDMEVIH